MFCAVLGSSSVSVLAGPGKTLRWAALLVLAAVALVLGVRSRRSRPARPALVVLSLGVFVAAVAVCSTAWSVEPRTTFERAGSFALLVGSAGLLGLASRTRPALAERLLQGVLAAACAAALAGLVVLLVAHADAIEPATTSYPSRFKGIGENPDTVAMLEGLAMPIALWCAVQARGWRGRALHLVVLLLLVGSISATASRGGLLAAFVGAILLASALRRPFRQRLSLAIAVCLTMAAATVATQIPKPLSSGGAPLSQETVPKSKSGGGGGSSSSTPDEAVFTGRLTDELYRLPVERRSLLSSSGRFEAWHGAISQADARPILGYGFGTENAVFVDRVQNFDGSFVENSFIGMYLQLGGVGLLLFVALVVAIALSALRLARRGAATFPAPALLGVVGAGIVLMPVQSYAYAVGNVATVSFWVVGFLVASASAELSRSTARRRGDVGAAA